MDRATLDAHVALARSSADYLTSRSTAELQSILRGSPTLPLEVLLNTGACRVDLDAHRIWRDAFWKGTFVRDRLLGLDERWLTPAPPDGSHYSGGRFWKRFDTLADGVARGHVVNFSIGALPGKPEVRQVAYPDDRRRYFAQGDDVLLLKYVNHPYRVVYDTIKIITPDTCIGVMHVGRFPRGLEIATFILSRNNHPFAHMSVPDHDLLFEGEPSRAPQGDDVAGSWKGRLVFSADPNRTLHNQFNPAWISARFEAGASGAGMVRRLWRTSRVTVATLPSCIRVTDAAGRVDDLRILGADTLLGRRYRRGSSVDVSSRYVLTRDRAR